MSKQFYFKQISLESVHSLNVKTVLFLTIYFIINTQFSTVLPIDRTLFGATTSGKSGPGSNGNEGVMRIPQSSSIIRASPLDNLVRHSLKDIR